jgi:hypothetical protein
MITITQRQRTFASYAVDILIYVVVLNLFVEYIDDVIIDSFTISVFTAAVLKILLDLILRVEHQVSEFFAARKNPIANVLRVTSVWLILFASKFLILEVIDIIFGEHVELGGFLLVLALVATMIIAREVFARIYESLGDSQAAE